ncbi:MAG: PH domain-containing protein [Legionellaceae bacterium]|nr:PH domain-containing protein [Legionellaceae bacterium]
MLNDRILYQSKLHYILFFWPVILGILGVVVLCLSYPMLYPIGYAIIGMGVFLGIMQIIPYTMTSLTLTPEYLTLSRGFFQQETVSIQLSKIVSISIQHSLLGSILQYGSIEILGQGESVIYLTPIPSPLTWRRCIEQAQQAISTPT